MNKTALITGAAVGIGRGIALVLARAGYNLALHCHNNRQRAEDLQNEIEASGIDSQVAVIQVDLSSDDGPEAMMYEFGKLFNSLDLFVNNSGLTMTAPFLETTRTQFDTMCRLNLRGSYFCIQQAARFMIEREQSGNIIIISSNNDEAHFANASGYGTIKAGLSKLAEHAALELARYHIRVNTIAPGWTDTGASRMGEQEPTYYKIPLKRWCTPEEIGKTVLFFDSDAAKSITGARIVVDGGALLLSDRGEKYGL